MDSDVSYDDSDDSGNDSTDNSDGKSDIFIGVQNDEDDDGPDVLNMHELVASDVANNSASEHGTMDIEDDYPFQVLSTDELVGHMDECIKNVNTIVQLPPTITRILLNHFRWDKEKLYESYYDGDRSKLFREAKIIDPSLAVSSSASSSCSPSPTPYGAKSQVNCPIETCIICCRDLPSKEMAGIACGHRFCKDCWSCYLTTKIMEEGMGHRISCAAHSCEILVDDQTVMSLVTDPKVKAKYQHLITNSFVECNRLLRWCPKPECNHVIKVSYADMAPVKCTCGTLFCFLCGENWHEPVKCDLLKRWKKKLDDDSETSNWIAANTKECPKCSVTIEKDGGCNHMVCKNQNCKTEFCWVCLGPWEPHGSSWYSCNRFDEDEAKAARDAQERSRAALQRYLFYCNRFMNHMQSLRFENKLYASVKEKMEEMQQHNMTWIEVQFLKKAVDVLCQCRQTLMYTYVFAYYLSKNNQSQIFQANQSDLEAAVEALSEYLERDITKENISDIKQRVQDKLRYCEGRRKVLLVHVQEGYDKDWWEYTIHANLPSTSRPGASGGKASAV